MIGENIHPTALMGGHMHCLKVVRPGDELDHHGQKFPTVIGSYVDGQDPYYAGAGFELRDNATVISFTDSEGKTVKEEII